MTKRFRSDEEPQDFGFLSSPKDGAEDSGDGQFPEVPPASVPIEHPTMDSADLSSPSPSTSQPEQTQSHRTSPPKRIDKAPPLKRRVVASDRETAEQGRPTTEQTPAEHGSNTPAKRQRPIGLVIYAVVVTLLLLYFMMTSKSSRLESLPDIRPLKGNEFQQVPESVQLPDGHTLKLGQSTRFGDVLVTPVKVTHEPLTFESFMTKEPNPSLTTPPVLKLHLTMKNVASDYSFPPFDSGLMSHRSPPEADDESVNANSFLRVSAGKSADRQRFLNFVQSMDNPFLLIGQNSAKPIAPGETMETFVASSVAINSITLDPSAECTWRVQIRKGVHQTSGNGVTTLIDVIFKGSDVQTL